MRVATAKVEIERAIAYYEDIPGENRTEQARRALLDKVSEIRIGEHYEWVTFQRRLMSEESSREHPTGGARIPGLHDTADGSLQ